MNQHRKLTSIAQVAPVTVVVLVVVGLPLGLLATYSFRESSFLGVGSGPTLEQYRLVFDSAPTVRTLLKTLAVAFSVSAVITALAFVVSYALTFRLRGRAAVWILGVIVAAGFMSLLVRVFAWTSILGTNGVINGALQWVGLTSSPVHFFFFGYFAIGVTMTYLYLPIGVLVVFSSMQEIDPLAVQASRDLGAGRWRTVFNVVAPQARVGLIGAFALSAILACSDYVTPRLVGGASGQMVGASVQDLALSGGDLPGAAALMFSLIGLAAIGVGLIALAIKLLSLLTSWLEGSGTFIARAATRVTFPTSRYSFSVPATGLLVLYLILPTLLVVLFSLNAGQTTGLPLTGITTHWYPDIVGRAGFADALRGSLVIASVSVVAGTMLGVPVAFALTRLTGNWKRIMWVVVLLPALIPGVLLGASLLAATAEANIHLGISFTAVVHSTLVVTDIVIIVYARLHNMGTDLVEAARDLGASAAKALRTVTFPLLLPSIVGAALLAVALSLDELFVTNFTIGTDTTIPIWLFGQARRGFTPGINAIGVMLLLGTLLAFGLAVAAARRTILATGSDHDGG